MGKPLAITASLVDVRNIAAHKCVRLEVHVPVEQAGLVLEAFGWPTMVNPVPVAIARLDLSAAKPQAREAGPDTRGIMNIGLEHIAHEESQKPKRKMADLPIAQRAALLCQRQAFWRWMREERGILGIQDEHDAATELRSWCAISSRSQFSTDSIAAAEFERIEREFNEWLTQP